MGGRAWTATEDDVLATFYPVRGAFWDGWAELLPGRSVQAIRIRASDRGIVVLPEAVSEHHRKAAIGREERRRMCANGMQICMFH